MLPADGPEFVSRYQLLWRPIQRTQLDLDLVRALRPAEQRRAAIRAEPVAARPALPAAELAGERDFFPRPDCEEGKGGAGILPAGLAMADPDPNRIARNLIANPLALAAA